MHYIDEQLNNVESKISKHLVDDVIIAIKICDIKFKKGRISSIREKIHSELMNNGWSPEVHIDPSSRISITSLKEGVGLCIQTGNMGRMYADLLKLQSMYKKKIISCAIFIVPMKKAAKSMGDNLVNYERLVNEIKIFADVITLPIIVFGFYE